MENDILKHRMSVMNNIAKSFGYEKSEDLLEKAESIVTGKQIGRAHV